MRWTRAAHQTRPNLQNLTSESMRQSPFFWSVFRSTLFGVDQVPYLHIVRWLLKWAITFYWTLIYRVKFILSIFFSSALQSIFFHFYHLNSWIRSVLPTTNIEYDSYEPPNKKIRPPFISEQHLAVKWMQCVKTQVQLLRDKIYRRRTF